MDWASLLRIGFLTTESAESRFGYFAYGSNLWWPQIIGRCPSARVVGRATLFDWRPVYDKGSKDGSTKLNIQESVGDHVEGLVYDVDISERESLDQAEPSYKARVVEVVGESGEGLAALTYVSKLASTEAKPYEWYVSMVVTGALEAGLDDTYIEDHLRVAPGVDPLAPGLRVAHGRDLPQMRAILSAGISGSDGHYSAHPGDLNWWTYHGDPRVNMTHWIQPDHAVLVLDESGTEINVFVAPPNSPIDLIKWSQRRLLGVAEVGWVDDDDRQLVTYLQDDDYEVVHTERNYEWDLESRDPPTPEPPDGWTLRVLIGESEADSRRVASHAAFKSTMSQAMHLERYLRFMRSPVYEPDRDLVAVAPDGTIGAFMIWWPDHSGIAQIEPFGTHPEFHRQGIGRSLMYYGLRQMKEAGISTVRVGTGEERLDATAFYEGVGFEVVGRLRWWKKRA